MLDQTGFLSVNQLIAKQQLLADWNVKNAKIEPLYSMINNTENVENACNLRSATNNHIRSDYKCQFGFPGQLRKLWNHKNLGNNF